MAASPIACDGRRVMYSLSSPNCARQTATLASPPPKVAPSTGDWRKRSNPGGLRRSMISPNVTTLLMTALTLRGADVRDDSLGVGAELRVVAGGDGLGVGQRRADADRDRSGANPVAGVVERDAAGRHQLDVRQRASNVLDVPGPERGGGKDLHDVSAGVPRVEDFRRAETARHHRRRLAAWQASITDRRKTGLTTKLRARIDDASRGIGIGDRPRAEQKALRHLWREVGDQLHGARHGHGHFERGQAALGKRVDDAAQPARFLDSDDGDDPRALDGGGD